MHWPAWPQNGLSTDTLRSCAEQGSVHSLNGHVWPAVACPLIGFSRFILGLAGTQCCRDSEVYPIHDLAAVNHLSFYFAVMHRPLLFMEL